MTFNKTNMKDDLYEMEKFFQVDFAKLNTLDPSLIQKEDALKIMFKAGMIYALQNQLEELRRLKGIKD